MFSAKILITAVIVSISFIATNGTWASKSVSPSPTPVVTLRQGDSCNSHRIHRAIAFTRNLADIPVNAVPRIIARKLWYGCRQKYNVLVFNIATPHIARFDGLRYYKEFTFKGSLYGAWLFKSGTFQNVGEVRPDIWAWRGKATEIPRLLLFEAP